MKCPRLSAFLIAAAAASAAVNVSVAQQVLPAPATRPTSAPAAVPVRAVVLYSSGVGYFEHYGTVRGDGSADLMFKTAQINDILKSLVLQDMDGGIATAVTYPTQDPIAKTLRSFQVDLNGDPSVADLLKQLRGAKVTIAVGADKTTGTILGLETRQAVVHTDHGDQTTSRPVLNLLAGGKIVSQPMDAITSTELDDPQLQDELTRALTAVAGARDQDKKPVRITFSGTGDRHVRIGYVVQTPIWKASYRLILSDQRGGPATTRPTLADGKLQGWAIVDNQTDNDWTDVQLTLVSGRPISFVEDLYQPLYVPRPVVEPDLFASLRPQTYAGGMDGDASVAPVTPATPPTAGPAENREALKRSTRRSGGRGGVSLFTSAGGGQGGEADELIDPTASVRALASATSMGALFQYTVGNVSLPRQRSAMIPIIADPIDVERVSIYNPRVLPRNPLNGAKVKNTTKDHLLAGPITVLDGAAYAGDAQIDDVPPGQERLLSYGVDLQMLVDAADNKAEDAITTGKIARGLLTVTHKYVRSQSYVAENRSPKDKTLIVEHPRADDGWTLTGPAKPTERTDAVYRFTESVPAGKQVKLTVDEQQVADQELAILPADLGPLDLYRRTGEIPTAVRDALAKVIEQKQAMTDTERQIADGRTKLTEVTAEQGRIRENLRTIAATSDYYKRLMIKLDAQETDIEASQKANADSQKKLDDQRKALEAYVTGLNVG